MSISSPPATPPTDQPSPASAAPSGPPPDIADEPDAGPPRALKAAVIGMAVILVFGFIAVFITIGMRIANPDRADEAADTATVPVVVPPRAFGAVSLNVPDGAEVLHTALDGARGLVTVRLPEGGQAVIAVDLSTGAELGRLTVE